MSETLDVIVEIKKRLRSPEQHPHLYTDCEKNTCKDALKLCDALLYALAIVYEYSPDLTEDEAEIDRILRDKDGKDGI